MKQLVIGIAGGTGSGKTTVTNKVLEKLDRDRVAVIQHDSYYRDIGSYGGTPPDSINFDHPDTGVSTRRKESTPVRSSSSTES